MEVVSFTEAQLRFSQTSKKVGFIAKQLIGDQQIVNGGDFTNASSWAVTGGMFILDGRLNGFGDGNIEQSETPVVGKPYRIEIDNLINTAGGIKVSIGGVETPLMTESNTTYVFHVTPINTGNTKVIGVGWTGSCDNLKISAGEQSDTLDMIDPNPKAIWVASGGTIRLLTMSGTSFQVTSVPSDQYIDWIRIKRLYKSDTSMTSIIGLY